MLDVQMSNSTSHIFHHTSQVCRQTLDFELITDTDTDSDTDPEVNCAPGKTGLAIRNHPGAEGVE